jgi:hypothetical protein
MKSVSQKKFTRSLVLGLALLLLSSAWVAVQPTQSAALGGDTALADGIPFPLSIHGTAAAVLKTGIFASPMTPTMSFAMADFTGDTNPDLVTAEMDWSGSSSPHYWIEIQLSEGRRQLLRLTAPFGGLLITPKDVTGDGNLDLVVRSALSRAPVAVFLNDGNGHFSRANVAAFANALHDGFSEFGFAAQRTYFGVALAWVASYAEACPAGSLRYSPEEKGSLLVSNRRAAILPFPSIGTSRAPPSLA